MSYLPNFSVLLTPDVKHVTSEDEVLVMKRHEIVTCPFPTGKMVGCDPLVDPRDAPFTAEFPPGNYEMVGWIAHMSDKTGKHEFGSRLAALEVVIRAEPTVSWEMALWEGGDVSELSDEGFFGYPVDAGTGTLADPVTIKAISEMDGDLIEEIFIPAEHEQIIVHKFDEPKGAIAVVVESGWGDGMYPTFIGRNADKKITRFVTDFLVVPPKDNIDQASG